MTKSQIVTQEKSLAVALCSAESRREAGKKNRFLIGTIEEETA
jgi:hypothetical protein